MPKMFLLSGVILSFSERKTMASRFCKPKKGILRRRTVKPAGQGGSCYVECSTHVNQFTMGKASEARPTAEGSTISQISCMPRLTALACCGQSIFADALDMAGYSTLVIGTANKVIGKL